MNSADCITFLQFIIEYFTWEVSNEIISKKHFPTSKFNPSNSLKITYIWKRNAFSKLSTQTYYARAFTTNSWITWNGIGITSWDNFCPFLFVFISILPLKDMFTKGEKHQVWEWHENFLKNQTFPIHLFSNIHFYYYCQLVYSSTHRFYGNNFHIVIGADVLFTIFLRVFFMLLCIVYAKLPLFFGASNPIRSPKQTFMCTQKKKNHSFHPTKHKIPCQFERANTLGSFHVHFPYVTLFLYRTYITSNE